MSRYPAHRIPYSEQDRLWSVFCVVISRLKQPDEIKRFLKDLLNRQERIMFVRRLHIAKLLAEDETYEGISRKLHTSHGTIARVQRWLEFGRGGYKRAILQLLALEGKKFSKRKTKQK